MRMLIVVAVLALTSACLVDQCRFNPESCGGGPGGACDRDSDCAQGLDCCEDDGNCGDGMCTTSCDRDGDCPFNMLCQHGLCFFACGADADCADGMSCEHGNTVCEW